MQKGKDYAKTVRNQMGSPPYYDATPPRMSRSGGTSKGGDKWSIPNTAKYGTGEGHGDAPTRMDRRVPKGKSGNNFEIPANGPARSSRKDTGANSHMGRKYGVGGVTGGGNGNYGGS